MSTKCLGTAEWGYAVELLGTAPAAVGPHSPQGRAGTPDVPMIGAYRAIASLAATMNRRRAAADSAGAKRR